MKKWAYRWSSYGMAKLRMPAMLMVSTTNVHWQVMEAAVLMAV